MCRVGTQITRVGGSNTFSWGLKYESKLPNMKNQYIAMYQVGAQMYQVGAQISRGGDQISRVGAKKSRVEAQMCQVEAQLCRVGA